MLTFQFSGAAGEMTQSEMLAAGMVGKQVQFSFSEDWAALRKVAVYRAGSIVASTVDVQEVDTIPPQVLAEPLQRLYVGIYGISEDGSVVTPTIFVEGPFIHISATLADDPDFDPENTFWIRLEEAMGELTELATGEKSSLVAAINELAAQKNADFLKNVTIQQAYDEASGTHYTALRIFKERLDGQKQYPFVYAPNGAGAATLSPKDLAGLENWPLVINAGIFNMDTGCPDGLLIQNGTAIQEGPSATISGCKPLTIDFQGDLGFAEADAASAGLSGIVSAVCGFLPIVVDHQAVSEAEWGSIPSYAEKAQRQIIGQYENGDYAIVTCEGRRFGASEGWTIPEAQALCLKLGLKFAYNLDGGGSTGTMVDKKQLNTVYEGPTGRKVPTFILFNGGTRLTPGSTDAYTALDYLQVNEGAYINTGIAETSLFSAEYKVLNENWTPPKGHVLSSTNTFHSFLKGSYNEGEELLVSNFRGNAPTDVAVAAEREESYTIRNDCDGTNVTVSFNGTEMYTTAVGSTASDSNPYYLFAYGGNPTADRYWFSGKLYYLKLWNVGGRLAHHFIPVRRKDGVCGLYDKVTGAFLVSSSGVAFGGA